MNRKINIAIDGYSACGKSSTAKAVAKRLHYTYIDSGAMYRAVTYYFLKNNVSIDNAVQVAAALDHIDIHFVSGDNSWITYLNGEDVEEAIRTLVVSSMVSPVSAISAVRRKLVQLQQAQGHSKGVVMDGRDIGTVVFPDAELKIFMTADILTRTLRRQHELLERGISETVEAITQNLLERDNIDSSRADSPLTQASDAILLDTTHLDFQDQVNFIVNKALAIIGE